MCRIYMHSKQLAVTKVTDRPSTLFKCQIACYLHENSEANFDEPVYELKTNVVGAH